MGDALKLNPSNAIEVALGRAQRGEMNIKEFISLLLQSPLYVPSLREIGDKGEGLQPVVFERNSDRFLTVFSGLDRAKVLADTAPFCISMSGAQLLQRVPTGFGIVINPRFDIGLEIPSFGIQDIKRDFAASA